ncbi:MAG TPA: DUF4189 domain-containing protein [Lacipirellulaceae bacterium]|nr:DUF4189 domain-containing protein [Lacipirellulaceae bacterium]
MPVSRAALRTLSLLLMTAACLAGAGARAQSGFYASIAYSQSTGKLGYSARQATTKAAADELALRMCGAPDAKVFMWAQNQWVAAAVVEGVVGSAGFGRGASAAEAQQKALAEVAKRAHGHGQRVALCVHSSGSRLAESQLLRVAPTPVKSKTGFFAALAFSPSTGKIGATAGKARTVDEAKKLALADCDAPDAKVFMWGDQWIAIATSPDKPGIAGFGPGATREAAEQAAVAQATKYAKGSPVAVARVLFSTGAEAGSDAAPVQPASAEGPILPPAAR